MKQEDEEDKREIVVEIKGERETKNEKENPQILQKLE